MASSSSVTTNRNFNVFSNAKLPWWQTALVSVLAGAGAVSVGLLVKYRNSIKKRLRQLEQRLEQGLVYRDTSPASQHIRCLELEEDFLKQYGKEYPMMSMGQYLSQLRVTQDGEDNVQQEIPAILQKELEAVLGGYLLSKLGPRIGPAMLPLLGITKVDSWLTAVAGTMASWVAARLLIQDIKANQQSSSYDVAAAFPFTVGEMVSVTNINQKMAHYGSSEITPLDKLRQGEVGYSIRFDESVTNVGHTRQEESSSEERLDTKAECESDSGEERNESMVPNPFLLEEHLETAIQNMEARIRSNNNKDSAIYDPDNASFPPPVPFNERLLPDLYLGWGQATCTHTQREILLNRIIAVLLNKLSYNYYLVETFKTNNLSVRNGELLSNTLFAVDVSGITCHFPDEFVQALLKTGHQIEVCPRSTVTTFGLAACVKEKDGSFTGIPLGVFMRAGFEAENGDPLLFLGNHGGLDLSIRGPLVEKAVQGHHLEGQSAKCDIQFYVSIDGLCGWNSNHYPVVPWQRLEATSEVYNFQESLKAVRTTGILAVAFNSIATEMDLPFGGYGILGVCNDSAALVDMAVRGATNLYPLISTERYMWHTLRRLVRMQTNLQEQLQGKMCASSPMKPSEQLLEDVAILIHATSTMDSDIHSKPSRLFDALRRYDACYPRSIFQLTAKTKVMLQKEKLKYRQYTLAKSS
ncbi:unnamed protein product [Cylindrotheca closterium]|uniref:Uncharacterized protein n=1 Tax=Cylindrotheca closterium TaxID=2856 RepID=A0AAD2FS55_9STRA|nr:unnamed protein product [Cylindrotheca closterium]